MNYDILNQDEIRDARYYRIVTDILSVRMIRYIYSNLCLNQELLRKTSYNDFSAEVNKQGDICKIELPSGKILNLKADNQFVFTFGIIPRELYSSDDEWLDNMGKQIGNNICKALEKDIKNNIKMLRKSNKNKQLCFALQIIEAVHFTEIDNNKANDIRFTIVYGIDLTDEVHPEIGNEIIKENQKKIRIEEIRISNEKLMLDLRRQGFKPELAEMSN